MLAVRDCCTLVIMRVKMKVKVNYLANRRCSNGFYVTKGVYGRATVRQRPRGEGSFWVIVIDACCTRLLYTGNYESQDEGQG